MQHDGVTWCVNMGGLTPLRVWVCCFSVPVMVVRGVLLVFCTIPEGHLMHAVQTATLGRLHSVRIIWCSHSGVLLAIRAHLIASHTLALNLVCVIKRT